MLALVVAMLSAFYLSKVETDNIVPNEIKQPSTQPGETGNFDLLKVSAAYASDNRD